MPEGGRSNGALGVLSLSHVLGVLKISIPADIWYCNVVSSLCDDRKPGNRGCGEGENHATADLQPQFLKQYVDNTDSSQWNAGVPGTPKQHRSQHPLHYEGAIRWPSPVPGYTYCYGMILMGQI